MHPILAIVGPELEHVIGKSRRSLISLIRSHQLLEKLEDKGMAELLCLRDKINEYQMVGVASPSV